MNAIPHSVHDITQTSLSKVFPAEGNFNKKPIRLHEGIRNCIRRILLNSRMCNTGVRDRSNSSNTKKLLYNEFFIHQSCTCFQFANIMEMICFGFALGEVHFRFNGVIFARSERCESNWSQYYIYMHFLLYICFNYELKLNWRHVKKIKMPYSIFFLNR